MKYKILYAHGQTFSLKGQLFVYHFEPEKGGTTPAINKGNEVNMLDPRAIIWAGSKVVYHPRKSGFNHHPSISEWLDKHPEWPNTNLGLN